jgi:hypothetical protein
MSLRSCRVTVQDIAGVSHSVEVTAGTLYEAVAQGLAAIQANDWVAGIAQGLNVVIVSVADANFWIPPIRGRATYLQPKTECHSSDSAPTIVV